MLFTSGLTTYFFSYDHVNCLGLCNSIHWTRRKSGHLCSAFSLTVVHDRNLRQRFYTRKGHVCCLNHIRRLVTNDATNINTLFTYTLIVQRIRVKLALYVVKASKFCTNETYNIKIKIRLGGVSKIFCFCSHANMAASDKGISLKKKFLRKILLNVTN